MKGVEMKSVACYCRVSKENDVQNKGLESQEKALAEYCANHGYADIVWYKDKLSGNTTSRPAFDKLKNDIFLGKISVVLVWKLDRLSRKGVKEGLTILTDWLKHGVRVVSITERIDMDGAVGEMLLGIFFALARMQREALIENTKRGLKAAQARGVKLGKRPSLFAKDIVPLLDSGYSMADVARQLGRSRQACYLALKREGIVR